MVFFCLKAFRRFLRSSEETRWETTESEVDEEERVAPGIDFEIWMSLLRQQRWEAAQQYALKGEEEAPFHLKFLLSIYLS